MNQLQLPLQQQEHDQAQNQAVKPCSPLPAGQVRLKTLLRPHKLNQCTDRGAAPAMPVYNAAAVVVVLAQLYTCFCLPASATKSLRNATTHRRCLQ